MTRIKLTGLAAAKAGVYGLQGEVGPRYPRVVRAALWRREGRALARLARRWDCSYAEAVRRAIRLVDGVSQEEAMCLLAAHYTIEND